MDRLHLSVLARSDLAEIRSYIEKELDDPTAALSTVRKIMQDIRSLERYPQIGPLLRSIADVENDYRFLVTGNYLTFYRVHGQDVYVDRVLYGRRDYLQILLGRALDKDLLE